MLNPNIGQRSPTVMGDAPKQYHSEDEFGLAPFSQALAEIISSRVTTDGYSIGIEGKWGSGKSTLLNFLQASLASSEYPYQQLIRFEPWLVGKKNMLLANFFALLATKIAEATSDSTVRSKLKPEPNLGERIVARLNAYSEQLSIGIGAVEYVSALDPTGHTKIGSAILREMLQVIKFFNKPAPSLESLKNLIVADLLTLQKLLPELRFTIIIDDTDRLDPDECIEILRLIKAVANFPLVIYVVGFDRSIMSAQIHSALEFASGEDYLEKIFQQLVPLPPQEPFALRRFVRAKLAECFPDDMALPDFLDSDRIALHDSLFDKWLGHFLKTPRDAVRLCDAVKFGWPQLCGEGDFLDFVWLQLIKLRCHPLYEWTEGYVANLGSYRDGGRPGDDEPATFATKLKTILQEVGWSTIPNRSGIHYFLPGLRSAFLEGTKSTAFQFTPRDELSRFENGKRLGSPSHWRLYFAFKMPSYALDDNDLDQLVEKADRDWSAASKIIRELARRDHHIVGYYLDVALDRLNDRADQLKPAVLLGLARAFADTLDELPRGTFSQFTGSDPWRRAIRILRPSIGSYWSDIVTNGRSINWLAVAMRDQGFALGVTDPNRTASDRQWLSRQEFDQALAIILQRFRDLGIDGICREPEPLQILFCWLQLGDKNELLQAIQKATESDAGLILVLKAMRSPVNSSDTGFHLTLQEDNVGHFLDSALARERLTRMIQSASELQGDAARLLANWSER